MLRLLLSTLLCCLSASGFAAANRRDPPKAAPFTVVVLGDGFGEVLADGLRMNLASQAEVQVLNRTHAPYGLSDEPAFAWPIAIQNLFAGQGGINAAAMMLGVDDVKPLRAGTETVAPGTPRWTVLYGDRVQAVADLFRKKGLPLTWVGLPITGDDDLSARFSALNEITRDRAVKGGASYVDSWDAFVNDEGKYSQVGPDLNGRIVKLRTADGLDFTRAGARKLASFVEPDLRQDREKAKAPADAGAVVVPDQPEALDIDINAQIRREAGLAALPSSGSPVDARGGPAGPVVNLNAPATSADGRLVERTGSTPANLNGTTAERALVQGQPVQPRPGRMDDFTWPRP